MRGLLARARDVVGVPEECIRAAPLCVLFIEDCVEGLVILACVFALEGG